MATEVIDDRAPLQRRAPRSAEQQAKLDASRRQAHDNWGRVLGVMLFPGARLWRRSPILAAGLLVAGVVLPVLAVGLIVSRRHHLAALADTGWALKFFMFVGVAMLAARAVATIMTVPTVAYRARLGFLSRGLLSVAVLAIPTVLGVVRLDQASTVVTEVFNQGKGQTKVVSKNDNLSDQVRTIMLVGSDAGINRPGFRTDSMMLAFIDKKSGRAALMSIPRGLMHLRFPPDSAMGKQFPKGYTDTNGSLTNAINSYVLTHAAIKKAYTKSDRLPGLHALMEGLSYSFDVTIDDYVMVNSCAFIKIIDSLGGVVVDIPKAIPTAGGQFPCTNFQVSHHALGPGRVLLDGTAAFSFARSRKADSDFYRMARQRQLLQALAQQVSFSDVLRNFGSLVDAVKDDVKTSLSVDAAKSLATALQKHAQSLAGVGLVPPLFIQSRPDWQLGHQIIQDIKQSLISGTLDKRLKTLNPGETPTSEVPTDATDPPDISVPDGSLPTEMQS